MTDAGKPSFVQLIHDRFIYRWRKTPFGKSLIVVAYDTKRVLVAARENGLTWAVRWKDVRILSFK